MSRVPRLLAGHNLRSLPLSPAEAYLVSRFDGILTEHELALVAGMSPAEVAATVDRLARMGAVAVAAATPEPPRTSMPPSSNRGPHGHSALDPGSPSPPLYDPAELDEPAELEPEKKRRVLDLFYRIEEMTYYELLGIDEQAEKKQIKSAYYASAPEFHPDKYFRKNLGSYKQKIEAIFARITLAHDTLTQPKKREEYDAYLEQTHKNRAMSAMLSQPVRDVAAVKAAVQEAAAAAVAAQRDTAPSPGRYASTPPPPMSQPVTMGPRAAPYPAQAEPAPFARGGVSQDELLRQRREALARKLTGGAGRRTAPVPPAANMPPPPPAAPDPAAAERAAEALRMRHEAAVNAAKRQQLQRYLDTGRTALERQDYAAAANAFRIAASLEPDDPRVQATCSEGLRVVAAALSDGYWKQALYEEGQDRWAEAALSYSKVCAGKPDSPAAHERVAYATLRSGGNVRRAVEFARKAVELDPRKPDYRITLARAYLAAGLDKSAHGELDRATELAPKDPKITAMVAQVRSLSTKDGKVS
jgi:curved DNA-binding protein CbpA